MALFGKHESRRFEDSGLTLDPKNANQGTKRGLDLLEESVENYGAARSIVSTADDVVIIGNKTAQVAAEKGIPFRVVETDGRELLVVKRRDLQYADPRAKELAIADNRVAEVDLSWDGDILAGFKAEGINVGAFFFDEELDRLTDGDGGGGAPPDDVEPAELKCPKCGFEWTRGDENGKAHPTGDDFK